MSLYKLTNQEFETYGGTTKWGENVTHHAAPGPPVLCTNTVIHMYASPEEAALFNCIHARIPNPILWECSDEEIVITDGLKRGVKQATTLRQVPLPVYSIAELARFAIYCVPDEFQDIDWRNWARDWLSGSDRSARAAWAAEAVAKVAARAVARAARAAAWAAEAAAEAKLDFPELIHRAVANEQKVTEGSKT